MEASAQWRPIDANLGDAVNVACAVPRYAAAGVSAVVMEDKSFPKDHSLRPGGRQELVPIGEFEARSKWRGSRATCWSLPESRR